MIHTYQLPPNLPEIPQNNKKYNHGSLNHDYAWCEPSSIVLNNEKTENVLYAMIGTWHEEDVIKSTVNNCFANGCTKVFIVDNDSKDRTKENAIEVGAHIIENYNTPFYDDDLRLYLMNKHMAEISAKEKLPRLWWLTIDADEFVCGPNGERLIDFLNNINSNYNCIGTDNIELYPTDKPHFVENEHPADHQKIAMLRIQLNSLFCKLKHWKHPLLLIKDGDYKLSQSRGMHIPFKHKESEIVLIEPNVHLPMFHVPYRCEENTIKRLQLLCGNQIELGGKRRTAGDDKFTGRNGAIKRWRSLKAVYVQDWKNVELPHSQMYGKDFKGIVLKEWKELLPGLYTFPRWYAVKNKTTKLALNVIDT